MATSPVGPRLQDIDPEDLARRIAALVPGVDGDARFSHDVAGLVRYAQSGDVGSWQDSDDALGAIQTVSVILAKAQVGPGTVNEILYAAEDYLDDGFGDAMEDVEELDLVARKSSPLALLRLVMTAASGRQALNDPENAVSERHLSTLAGMMPSELRRRAANREIKFAEGGNVPTPEALRWLGVQKVPGFPTRSGGAAKTRG